MIKNDKKIKKYQRIIVIKCDEVIFIDYKNNIYVNFSNDHQSIISILIFH